MPEELYPNLFRLKIPLLDSPLKYLNSYVIKGVERNLIIDTGFNRPECRTSLLSQLNELNIDLATVDFFITHFHEDHIGLIGELVTMKNKIYFSRQDMANMALLQSSEPFIQAVTENGFSESEIRNFLDERPGIYDLENWKNCVNFIENNDVLRIGDFRFVCVHTPGHSTGHFCLYEPEKKFLISGDHILGDISPNITCWYDDGTDPLQDYMESLEKIQSLDVSLVLPGHREPFYKMAQRIDQLKCHHDKRLKEIRDILTVSSSSMNAFEVAAQMKWDIQADSWDDYPLSIKFFATGEANTHLRCLEKKKVIRRCSQGPFIKYSR